MAKANKTIFVCSECGNEYSTWQGQCRACGAWNSLYQAKTSSVSIKSEPRGNKKPLKLSQIDTSLASRIKTGISELDNVLNGGIVPGQVILLAGNPGIGKSTLLLQIADKIEVDVLYASGEESESQVALRAERLNIKNPRLDIISTGSINTILDAVDKKMLIVDSIQTVYVDDVESSAGSVTQIRESAFKLIEYAKANDIPVVLVGHITKEGNIAGPKLLEHMVDTVLYLEGDKQHVFRLLRVRKNRFGDDSEVGIFEMTNDGLIGVEDPSKLLKGGDHDYSGSSTSVAMEGNRPIAIEVQALVTKSQFGYAKRAVNGFSLNKLQLLCAVIQKRTGINILDQDVFVNIASGMQIKEPGIDLAVTTAIISSYLDKKISADICFFGEVGLAGDIRKVYAHEKRVKEAKKLGFKKIYTSENLKNISELFNKIKTDKISV
ncbi:MAG: hypothetical protein QG570_608 [Patescibacteria group bacterium]|nr:hypothetical protein [Patescibacteria group bacterium]